MKVKFLIVLCFLCFNTSREIAYAKYCGKKINSLEPIDLSKYTAE